MADTVKLEGQTKPEGKNPRQLRGMGLLPVSIYGKDTNLNIALDTHAFKLAWAKDKETKFEITYNKKTYSTVTKNVQINYATSEIQSVELQIV